MIFILIILAKPTCHKWSNSILVLDGEAMKATNVLWVGPKCRQGLQIPRLRPRFLNPNPCITLCNVEMQTSRRISEEKFGKKWPWLI